MIAYQLPDDRKFSITNALLGLASNVHATKKHVSTLEEITDTKSLVNAVRTLKFFNWWLTQLQVASLEDDLTAKYDYVQYVTLWNILRQVSPFDTPAGSSLIDSFDQADPESLDTVC